VRLVHLADLHLGFRQYHRVTPSGINQREADVGNAFRRAVDAVVELRPDLIVIAGDVFHSVRPMNAAIIHAFKQFARLRESLPEAAIVIIAGNHDRPRATETGCILRLFSPLGVEVVDEAPVRLAYPHLGLSLLAIPDQTVRPATPRPDPDARYNVLVMHGEVEGLLPPSAVRAERVPMEIPRRWFGADAWNYVALGHYHVHRQVGDRAWYAGSLDYTSTNPWAELAEERTLGLPGKGFVEVNLELDETRFHHVPPSRPFLELPPVDARGMNAADVDRAIRERVESCADGIEDRVVRLLVRNVPRHVVRELDHRALRDVRRRALHFQLDTRRPEIVRDALGGAPGRRPTLTEMLESYLAKRPMERDLDRQALVRLGLQYLTDASAAEQAGVGG
jgi:DNA repair protein SbcD/Mre11